MLPLDTGIQQIRVASFLRKKKLTSIYSYLFYTNILLQKKAITKVNYQSDSRRYKVIKSNELHLCVLCQYTLSYTRHLLFSKNMGSLFVFSYLLSINTKLNH